VGYTGAAGDYCIAREYPVQLDAAERRAVWRIAEGIIERNWPVVCLLAKALHREGRLNGRRIIELLQPKRGGLARRRRAAA
jgi:hypothetical protein